jgi:uncharacterized protein YndB with AHSA1/START domain
MGQDASTATRERPALRLRRIYQEVTPAQVWRAWTDPQALSVWFVPGEGNSVLVADTDVRVGGGFRVAFRMANGDEHDVSGVYREVLPQRRLVFTWAWRSTPERESLVTIRIEPSDSGTRLVFRHEQFFDQVARDNHERGWSGTFRKLDRFLQSATPAR